MNRYQANEERERLAAEEAALRNRMARFAPPSAMDRMLAVVLACRHDLDEMDDNASD